MTTSATTTRRARRAASIIPEKFPVPHALGDVKLFAAVLDIGELTVHRLRAEGRLPEPVRIGKLVKWPHSVMADIARNGIAPAATAA